MMMMMMTLCQDEAIVSQHSMKCRLQEIESERDEMVCRLDRQLTVLADVERGNHHLSMSQSVVFISHFIMLSCSQTRLHASYMCCYICIYADPAVKASI